MLVGEQVLVGQHIVEQLVQLVQLLQLVEDEQLQVHGIPGDQHGMVLGGVLVPGQFHERHKALVPIWFQLG